MDALQTIRRRFYQLRATDGWIAAALLTPVIIWQSLKSPRSGNAHSDLAGLSFDRSHGVDTQGLLMLASLEVDDHNWVHGYNYQPTPAENFTAMFDTIALDYETTTFIDLGAGKGRALLLATGLPFERCVGVELVPELADVAQRNLEQWGAKRAEIVVGDAASYEFPPRPLALYLYNPFSSVIMRCVIENLVRSLRQHPRRATVFYRRPEFADMWLLEPGFELAFHGPQLHIYEYRH